MSNIFDLIRNGVQLKPVVQDTQENSQISLTDSHQQLLRNTLANINRVTRGTSPDDESSDDDEFDD